MQPGSADPLDLHHVVGMLTRYNTSIDAEHLTAEHCRHFYTYLHTQRASPGLKRALCLSRDQAKKELRDASAAPGSDARPRKAARVEHIPRNLMYDRLLRIMIWFLRARWALWLRRNSGIALAKGTTFFLFQKHFYEGPHRLADQTTWAFLDVYAQIPWANVNWTLFAEYLVCNVFTCVPQAFVDYKGPAAAKHTSGSAATEHGSETAAFRGCYNRKCFPYLQRLLTGVA